MLRQMSQKNIPARLFIHAFSCFFQTRLYANPAAVLSLQLSTRMVRRII